jgi:hypothetical protein
LNTLRSSVACAIQRGNARIIRAGLIASAHSNSKYIHQPHSAVSIQSQTVDLYKHVVRSYDLRQCHTHFTSPSIIIPRPTNLNTTVNSNLNVNVNASSASSSSSSNSSSSKSNHASVSMSSHQNMNSNINLNASSASVSSSSSSKSKSNVNSNSNVNASSVPVSKSTCPSTLNEYLSNKSSSHPNATQFLNKHFSMNMNNNSNENVKNDSIVSNDSDSDTGLNERQRRKKNKRRDKAFAENALANFEMFYKNNCMTNTNVISNDMNMNANNNANVATTVSIANSSDAILPNNTNVHINNDGVILTST